VTAPAYPPELERWWLDRWQQHLGRAPEPDDIARLEQAIARLSDNFTTARSHEVAGYAESPDSLFAYGLFFFPQTFVRMRFILREALRPRATPVKALDLGAGTGAAGFALLAELAPAAVDLTAVDASAASLDAAARLFADAIPHAPAAAFRHVTADLAGFDAPGPWDIILISYALNELVAARPDFDAAAWLAALVGRLAPGGLLVLCEPIVKDSPLRLELVRDRLLASGAARVVAPCLHRQPCPMLARDEWCHDVRRWQPPASLRFLNRNLFRSIAMLKFSFLVLAAPGHTAAPGDASLARLVSPVHEPKGKIAFRGCAADGALHDYEVLARHAGGGERELLLALERGDVARIEDAQPLKDGRTLRARRVRLQDARSAP